MSFFPIPRSLAPALVTFHHLIRQFAPGIVEVNGLDLDVREEGVLVEKHRATSVVSNMEPVCEEFMVHMINRLLRGDNVHDILRRHFENQPYVILR